MIAKKSVFDLQDFVLLNNTFEFSSPNEDVDPDSVTKNYEIDIDYSVQPYDNTNLFFQVFVKIEINKGFVLPGYKLFIEGVGFFNFKKEDNLSDVDKLRFLQESGISICVNSLRGIIASLTSFGPFGKFILPSIDVSNIIDQKIAILKKRKANNMRKKETKK